MLIARCIPLDGITLGDMSAALNGLSSLRLGELEAEKEAGIEELEAKVAVLIEECKEASNAEESAKQQVAALQEELDEQESTYEANVSCRFCIAGCLLEEYHDTSRVKTSRQAYSDSLTQFARRHFHPSVFHPSVHRK